MTRLSKSIRKQRQSFSFLLVAFLFGPATMFVGWVDLPVSVGQEIKLRRGGSFVGKILKNPEENNGFYQFELESGAIIQIAKNEVDPDSLRKPQSEQPDYQAELKKYDLTKVEDHLKIAKWCTKNNLRVQKVKHLRQVIALDPDHEEARRLLKYTRHLHTGKWVLRDEYYQSIGYVREGVSMRLPQAQMVEKEKKSHADAVKVWKGKIPRLVTLLKSQRRFAEAKQELEEIDDVKAIPVLADYYQRLSQKKQQSEFDRQVKSLLLSIIAKFDILSAKLFLVNVTLNEPDDVLQDDAEQVLLNKHAQWTADYLIARLGRIPPTSKGLIHDRDALALQQFVNRASVIIEKLKDDADVDEAILPLINLVYMNRTLFPRAQQKKGGIGGNFSFDQDGGVGMSQGQKKADPRPVIIKTDAVRVLTTLTEQRYQYDKPAWLQWYLSQTLPTKIDLRRLD